MAQAFYKICPRCQQIYRSEFNFCVRDRELLVGDERIIAGRYVLRRQLGVGAMSEVHEAEQPQIRRLVAIKLLRHDREVLQRFDSEVQAIGRLKHENIVEIYDSGYTEARRAYIAMELLEGQDLSLHLKNQGPLPIARATRLWMQAVRAIAHAHRRGVVHRDIKPSNLFLTRRDGDDGYEEVLKVIDFSVAMILTLDDELRPTRPGDIVGTWLYMAPEQQTSGAVSPQFDVYALGMVLVEILTGSVPYWPNRRQTGVSSMVRAFLEAALQLHGHLPTNGLSAGFVSLVDDMLNPNPELRPASAQEVLKRARLLQEFQEGSAPANQSATQLPQSQVTPLVTAIPAGLLKQDPFFGIDRSGDSLIPVARTEIPVPAAVVSVDDLSEPTIANDADAQFARFKNLVDLVSPQTAPLTRPYIEPQTAPQTAPPTDELAEDRETWPAIELIISETPIPTEPDAPLEALSSNEAITIPVPVEAVKKTEAAVPLTVTTEKTERLPSKAEPATSPSASYSSSSGSSWRFLTSRVPLAMLFLGAVLGSLFFGLAHRKRPELPAPRRPADATLPVPADISSGAPKFPSSAAMDGGVVASDLAEHRQQFLPDASVPVRDLLPPTPPDLSVPSTPSPPSDGGAGSVAAAEERIAVRFVYYEGDGVDRFECTPGVAVSTQEDEESGKTSQIVRLSPGERCTATLGTRKKNYDHAALLSRPLDRSGMHRVHIQ